MNPETIVQAYDDGERNLEPLLKKIGWTSWLGVAELGLLMGSDIVEYLADRLSDAETATLELVNARINGTISLDQIESALEIARNPDKFPKLCIFYKRKSQPFLHRKIESFLSLCRVK